MELGEDENKGNATRQHFLLRNIRSRDSTREQKQPAFSSFFLHSAGRRASPHRQRPSEPGALEGLPWSCERRLLCAQACTHRKHLFFWPACPSDSSCVLNLSSLVKASSDRRTRFQMRKKDFVWPKWSGAEGPGGAGLCHGSRMVVDMTSTELVVVPSSLDSSLSHCTAFLCVKRSCTCVCLQQFESKQRETLLP